MPVLDWASTTVTIGYSSYDVFLNFRGKDTRNNFTDFLNLVLKDRGINAFIDSKKFWTGEAIGPACLGAIEGSKISIPVFSKGYAHSKWDQAEIVNLVAKRVLDELVSSTQLDECQYPIGVDSCVKDLLSLLSIDSNDVQFIGIYGSSGNGKTTIAEAAYNCILSTFNRHSFISDVSKQAVQSMGRVSLQK
ncbi:disease resistance protein RUN1-like [Macadamia integrifolia]|uniref:disease resistance protein RUN1-like n=1 Tax=Macadamia integrifolia TaxID=60698 RepID=UPI001C4EAD02|nr:disease resistance protein RUN1-like [Macadamia integrifolia]